MADGIDWGLAAATARRFSGRDVFSRSYHYRSLAPQMDELTGRAQDLVESHLGWTSSAGAARARVASRGDWIDANIRSFRRLLRPLTERLDEEMGGPAAFVAAKFAAVEVGAMLGWMSSRVLGQYDMLVLEDEDTDEQDLVYYVGPNLLALEKRFGFPPDEFRLWIALHEVTHRTQFTGIPWLRTYFLEQTAGLLGLVEPDPVVVFRVIGRLAEAVRTRSNPLRHGGIMALFASDQQLAHIERLGGLMSLLEGHGDVTMDRAGGAAVPSAERFGNVLRQRRSTMSGLSKLVASVSGMDAKLAQYQQGEDFIAAVERVGGTDYLNIAFRSAANLPTLAEIREPDTWMRRIGRPVAA